MCDVQDYLYSDTMSAENPKKQSETAEKLFKKRRIQKLVLYKNYHWSASARITAVCSISNRYLLVHNYC